jgi:ABC-type molybdate transport system ATPase subunit
MLLQVAARLGEAKVKSASARAQGMKEAAIIATGGQAKAAKVLADAQIKGAQEKYRAAAAKNAIWQQKVNMEIAQEVSRVQVEQQKISLQEAEFRATEIRNVAQMILTTGGVSIVDALEQATQHFDKNIAPRR